MKTIKVSLSSSGVESAIAQLQALKVDVTRKAAKVAAALADEGGLIASTGFGEAAYAGDNDVRVTVKHGAVHEIIARGNAVSFIEFGTGISHGYGYPGHKPAGVSAIGTYGMHHGSRRGWVYNGDPGNIGVSIGAGRVLTKGNPPNAVMYHVARELEQDASDMAEAIFSR